MACAGSTSARIFFASPTIVMALSVRLTPSLLATWGSIFWRESHMRINQDLCLSVYAERIAVQEVNVCQSLRYIVDNFGGENYFPPPETININCTFYEFTARG
jgi:hypothetical protein